MRDPVHVDDVASGIAAIALADRLTHDAYHVGWGRLASARQTVAALTRIVPGAWWSGGPTSRRRGRAPANAMRGPLRVDRLKKDLGWKPRHDLDSGLAAYVEWLRADR